ncbi:unnamed protein product [Peronospora belbahrii]|uniref:Uncharacterized protein n=1 Tax=Peronospora belbahrii TaxID=622444 RepID=A0ABN8CNN5_9STRA|nr:unnamed protein product [Peronospora belbahrii]
MSDDNPEWIYTTLECTPDVESSTGSQVTYANRTFYDIKGFSNFLARRGFSARIDVHSDMYFRMMTKEISTINMTKGLQLGVILASFAMSTCCCARYILQEAMVR